MPPTAPAWAPCSPACTSPAADFAPYQPNLRGLDWWTKTVPTVLPHLEPHLAELIDDELAFQQHLAETPAHAALPRGAIHADLFRDNVMFEGKLLAGVFDFYFAGVDCLLFDIAVCLNDWCIDLESGRLAEDRAEALVAAYESVRPLESAEIRLLPALMRAGALRFWLSRLWDVHLPRDAKLLKAHDPTHFERVLLQRRGRALASGAAPAGHAMKLLRAEPGKGLAWIRRAFQVFLQPAVRPGRPVLVLRPRRLRGGLDSGDRRRPAAGAGAGGLARVHARHPARPGRRASRCPARSPPLSAPAGRAWSSCSSSASPTWWRAWSRC